MVCCILCDLLVCLLVLNRIANTTTYEYDTLHAFDAAAVHICTIQPTNGWIWDGVTTDNIIGCGDMHTMAMGMNNGCDDPFIQNACAETCGTCVLGMLYHCTPTNPPTNTIINIIADPGLSALRTVSARIEQQSYVLLCFCTSSHKKSGLHLEVPRCSRTNTHTTYYIFICAHAS